jgi:hypothetical protein
MVNKEFKRMQQLAGINEIKVMPGGGYAKVLDEYIKSVLTQEEYYQDDPEAAEYFVSLKQNPPKALSADEAAKKIEEIDNTITEFSGAYPGEFYSEAVLEPLVDIGNKFPNLRSAIKQIIEILHESYIETDQDKQEHNEYILNQWREGGEYQNILDLYIRHIYTQNFKLLPHRNEGEGFDYINSLNNFPPKVNSLEELASTITTIDDTILQLKDTNEFHYAGVEPILNKIAVYNPRYGNTIHSLLIYYKNNE